VFISLVNDSHKEVGSRETLRYVKLLPLYLYQMDQPRNSNRTPIRKSVRPHIYRVVTGRKTNDSAAAHQNREIGYMNSAISFTGKIKELQM